MPGRWKIRWPLGLVAAVSLVVSVVGAASPADAAPTNCGSVIVADPGGIGCFWSPESGGYGSASAVVHGTFGKALAHRIGTATASGLGLPDITTNVGWSVEQPPGGAHDIEVTGRISSTNHLAGGATSKFQVLASRGTVICGSLSVPLPDGSHGVAFNLANDCATNRIDRPLTIMVQVIDHAAIGGLFKGSYRLDFLEVFYGNGQTCPLPPIC